MAGKELDPQRARAARDVVRQHPAMTMFALSPVLLAAGALWWFVGAGWAILLLVGTAIVAGAAVLRPH